MIQGIAMRLPTPYRPEADIVAHRLASLQGALDWAAAVSVASPWVQSVRKNPPPFWAMESLLREYPISSAEGLALMRLAEALLRVPDAETAIALTADQEQRLAAAINNATGKQVNLKVTVDPTVLGGIVATIGDTVIDGTVRTRIDQLKSRL